MTDFNRRVLKKISFSLGYYLAVLAGMMVAGKLGPAGPCTPGLDLIVLLYSALLTPVLWIKNAYLTFAKDKIHAFSLAIHSVAGLSWLVLFHSWL